MWIECAYWDWDQWYWWNSFNKVRRLFAVEDKERRPVLKT